MSQDIAFLEDKEIEGTFAHDDSDIKEEIELQYDENFWPQDAEEPTGYSYKGKNKECFALMFSSVKIS